MRGRYVTFDSNRTDRMGLTFSTFEETVPEPRVRFVDIPGGGTIDISEYPNGLSYGNGTHVITFMLYGEDNEARLAAWSAVMQAFHGKRANYSLSWRPGTYTGRASVSFEHRWDTVDVVTMTIVHDPYRTLSSSAFTKSVMLRMEASTPTAQTANIQAAIPAPLLVVDEVRATRAPSVSMYINGKGTVSGNPAIITSVAPKMSNGALWIVASLSASDWVMGDFTDHNQIINAAVLDTPNMADNDVAIIDQTGLEYVASKHNLKPLRSSDVTVRLSGGKAF